MIKKKELRYRHYHPTEGYPYQFDMMPVANWDVVTHVVIPEGRFFNDDELRELFVLTYRLTPENIELMKKWDRDNKRKDRFKPHHNGMEDYENITYANSCSGTKEDKLNMYRYLNGDISQIELDFRNFKRILHEEYMRHNSASLLGGILRD